LVSNEIKSKVKESIVEAIINSISSGILVLDREGNILLANDQFKDYYRSITHSIMPDNWNCAISSGNIFFDTIRNVYLGKKPVSIIIEPIKGFFLQFSSGVELFFEHLIGGMIEVREVTQFVEFDKLRKQFVSSVSHELRTPISVIVQSIFLIQKYKGNISKEKYTKLIDAISRNADLMTDLIENLLTISRIDEKRLLVKWARYNLSKLINNVITGLKIKLEDKNIMVIPQADENIELFGEKRQIAQVIRILLDNAIKYSYVDADIRIKVENHYQGNFNQTVKDGVLIQIIDEGRGIPEHDVPLLFKRFFRSKDVSDVRGTGLGLSIAKELVELHRGDIFVKSKYGEGTTFFVFLPYLKNIV
jgi:signal transduction histidine kinase